MLNQHNYPHHAYILITALNEGNSQTIRDLKELESLQSGKNLPYNYANTLKKIITRKIIHKLDSLAPNHGVINDNQIVKESENNIYVILNILPESTNILRSLPFFTCNATMCKIDNINEFLTISKDGKEKPPISKIYAAIISNPILNSLYWSSDKVIGSYEKNHKIKPAQTNNLANIYGTNKDNILSLNSLNLELCFLACGKLDFVIGNYKNYCDIIAAQYIIDKISLKYKIDYFHKKIIASINNKILDHLQNEQKTD